MFNNVSFVMYVKSAKMDVKTLLKFVVFASIINPSLAGCEQRFINENRCNYTIFCSDGPSDVINPNCDDDNAYVSFYITDSSRDLLSLEFFARTRFDIRVHEIIAYHNSWDTITTSAFRYFWKTIRLDISNNEITRVENEAFKNLIRLTYLNISHNNIETLFRNSFLISDLSNNIIYNPIQELDLSNNNIIELSNALYELSVLKRLYLQNNLLTNMNEYNFVNLKKLEYLNLHNNKLTFLNLTFTNLKMLQTLDISYNNLIKLSGYEINHLVAIKDFNASHNALISVESNCFNQAFSLQKVDFSYNKINMNIENEMFINNRELHYLNFYNNKIRTIGENSFKYCSLYYINFENNNISGDIKTNTFAGSHNFTKLDLSRQNINGIRNNAFINIDGLLYLNLSTNNIEIIETSSFVNTSLIVLDLSFNKISNLNFLLNCLPNLIELYVNNNNITVIPDNGFENQKQIKRIDLSMNRIKKIYQNSLPLNNLQYFNISGNLLSGVIKESVFSPAKYLRYLDLSYSSIAKIDNLAFVDLTALGRLDLSNNQIETIEYNNFNGVYNLYSLDISHNKLSNVTFSNKNLTNNLKVLYLNSNNLSNITDLFLKKSSLSHIDLSNNIIGKIFNVGADKLPNLTVLHLANNKIETFNNPQINTLTTLIDLELSSNKISHINLSYFNNLMLLDLGNNNLSYLNSTMLKNNEYLQSLDVSKNNITDLPPGTFQFVKNLKYLNISSNYLTKLRFGSLRGLQKTVMLDVSRNTIATLDVDVFHECNELKTLIIDYNRIKTLDVEKLILMSLRKLTTLSLGGNPISCIEIIHTKKSANVSLNAISQVEVTSIDKIYHEDNVHGIKCGDDAVINERTTVQSNLMNSTGIKNDFSSRMMMNHSCLPTVQPSTQTATIMLSVWCSLLTILLIAVAVVVYVKLFKKRDLFVSRNMTYKVRNSLELDGADFQGDLLGQSCVSLRSN